MPRRVQDIVPNNHRSIRDIPVERNSISAPIQPPARTARPRVRAQEIKPAPIEEKADAVPVRRVSVTPPKSKKRCSRKWPFVLMALVVVVAGIAYVASVYFSYATFTIAPKRIPISANSTYVAQNTSGKGALTYELAAVKGSASASVPATDGANISTSAKGKVTLYNSYSAQPQRLIAGTRLSDDTGRIYRLNDSVVVPGASGSSPGSITATVTADQPGESYNITKNDSISDFRIVAYKGTPRYDTMYARINTDIIGGFSGTKKTVSPSLLASTTAELQRKVTATLLSQVKSTVPKGYVMYDDAYVTAFSAPVIGGSDAKSATVAVQGTLYGILFKKDELVARVAGEQAISAFEGLPYDTIGLDALDFSIANAKEFSPEKKNTLIIKLKGEAQLVGAVPVDALKTKFAGLSLAETENVLRGYKPILDIEKSSGAITPPWSKVPSNPDRITVEVLTK